MNLYNFSRFHVDPLFSFVGQILRNVKRWISVNLHNTSNFENLSWSRLWDYFCPSRCQYWKHIFWFGQWSKLQSWTKMLRIMDLTMSSFKIRLLKALATTNTPPFPYKNNVEVRLDHFWMPLFNFGWGKGRGNSGTKSRRIGVLWVRKCKNRNTFCPRL